MNNQFNHYAKSILNNMNSIEKISGKMFQDTHPIFEMNFWMAHDQRNVDVLKTLNNTLNKIIDDANGGHKLLVEPEYTNKQRGDV